MSIAGVVFARRPPAAKNARRTQPAPDVLAARAASSAGVDEVVVVLDDEARADEFPDGTTLLIEEDGRSGTRALRTAIDWCQREGHDAIVVALATTSASGEVAAWRSLVETSRGPIVVLERRGTEPALARLDAEAWPAVPLDAPLAQVLSMRPELVVEIEVSSVSEGS